MRLAPDVSSSIGDPYGQRAPLQENDGKTFSHVESSINVTISHSSKVQTQPSSSPTFTEFPHGLISIVMDPLPFSIPESIENVTTVIFCHDRSIHPLRSKTLPQSPERSLSLSFALMTHWARQGWEHPRGLFRNTSWSRCAPFHQRNWGRYAQLPTRMRYYRRQKKTSSSLQPPRHRCVAVAYFSSASANHLHDSELR